MKPPRSILWMSLAALFMAIGLLAGPETKNSSAASLVPSSMVGPVWSITDTNTYTMRFFANNRYEKVAGATTETGYYTPTLSGNSWIIAATRSDGLLTVQYTFTFTAPNTGTASVAMAGSRRNGTFVEKTTPNGSPASMQVNNDYSAAGPSLYPITFETNGTFHISLPGYGDGTYIYTPGATSAKLELTYTNFDLVGDSDLLTLQFPANRHSGTQKISGQEHPISGTFTLTLR